MKLEPLSVQGFFRSAVAALTMCSVLACGAQQAQSTETRQTKA
jgi:hypothetical protein